MGHYGSLWVAMGRHGLLWVTMGSYGLLWVTMDHYGLLWVTMIIQEMRLLNHSFGKPLSLRSAKLSSDN